MGFISYLFSLFGRKSKQGPKISHRSLETTVAVNANEDLAEDLRKLCAIDDYYNLLRSLAVFMNNSNKDYSESLERMSEYFPSYLRDDLRAAISKSKENFYASTTSRKKY